MTNSKRERTEKSRYKHQSTGDHCTCSAYIAEILCTRNAQNKNKGSLPYKFWNSKAWNWTFKKQVLLANKLLKTYAEVVLVKAINSRELKSVFSLQNKRVLPIVKRYQAEFLVEEKERQTRIEEKAKQPVQKKVEHGVRKKTYGSKSVMSKLRGMEKDGERKKEEDL